MRLKITLPLMALLFFGNHLFAQQITISEQKAPLEKILKMIRSQSGYDFIFDRGDLSGTQPVSIDVRNASVDEALKVVLTGQPLTYNIKNRVVSIFRLRDKAPPSKPVNKISKVNVVGLITDEDGIGLDGAVIHIKNTDISTVTGKTGFFVLRDVDDKAEISVTYLGYEPAEVLASKKPVNLKMIRYVQYLDTVNIVSTGYQYIPKERATGSFVLIDSALLNRKVGKNILDRLDGVTSGLLFNKNTMGNTPVISIRDRSTISANANPLIILDNFPYDGDVANINPQDVKSITILKDAAAASIWGARSGNGVIVITTKTGAFNQKPVISFNTNITFGSKPNQYYMPQLTNQEYIGVEQFLFSKGKYNPKINSGYMALSPAVEVMLLRRNNQITDARQTQMLDSIAGHDNRADLNKYFYRTSLNQQYQLSATGGGVYNKYYVALGYDNDLGNNVTNSDDRFTVNANNTLSLLKNKLRFLTGLMFTSSNTKIRGAGYQPLYPYENVAGANGNPLAVTDGTLRLAYVDTVGKGKLLDWHKRPLDELNPAYYHSDMRLTDYKINLGVNYQVIPNLTLSVNYTYDKGITEYSDNNSLESYYTRNLINSFTQIDPVTGAATRPVPLGDIVDNNNSSYYSHYGRGQINYENEFASKHAINVIAGYEFKDYQSSQDYTTLYGYDPATATNLNATINQLQDYPSYYNGLINRIPLNIGNAGTIDRYVSYYTNGSYIYDQKYILSASSRRDESNIFGVKTNQKGVPLWSTGLAWNLSKEDFYHFSSLPYLKLRATYGTSGNVDKTTSAFLTTQTINAPNLWGASYLQISNPPNPSLRWEKVQNTNFGIDFGMKNNRLTGSLEYWIKNGTDLIGQSPIAPQTGVSIFKGNSANTLSKGIDLTLNSTNIKTANFKWFSTFLFNYNTDKITNYKVKQGSNGNIVSQNYINPLEGYSYYSIFSYKWMGLDNAGNPQSILNGKVSEDYAGIANSTNSSELVYSGTSTPKYFGSFRNSFLYKSWELSFNIIYKLGYVFRRSSLSNYNLYQGYGSMDSYQQSDYDSRWQKPGDELITNVPSLIYPAKMSRDNIYNYSNILVEKADHIRLQDIQLNYQLAKEKYKKLPFSNLSLYLYASNLLILWKATHYKIDPDYPNSVPIPTTISLGVKANF